MRQICVMTGSRAEYGLLRPLLYEFKRAKDVDLKILVTGTHLSKIHGYTVSEIEADGFKIAYEVDMVLSSDEKRATGQSLGLGVIGLSNALSILSPDILLILGDRYEALAAAQSAMILGIPIAHVHGGEATEGLIDEAIRHSITKMAHFHFVTADEYLKRVVQLGEQPSSCHNFGALALDNIAEFHPISRCELEKFLKIELADDIFLVTFHPVTLDGKYNQALDNLLADLSKRENISIIFSGSNSDPLGQEIDKKVQEFCKSKVKNAVSFSSLGYLRYLSLMKMSSLVVGNSSSGIIEAPAIGVPTVNIGPRQQGRLRAPSIVDCEGSRRDISAAIDYALSIEFRKAAKLCVTPYGEPGAAKKICNVLKNVPLDGVLMKRFHDI